MVHGSKPGGYCQAQWFYQWKFAGNLPPEFAQKPGSPQSLPRKVTIFLFFGARGRASGGRELAVTRNYRFKWEISGHEVQEPPGTKALWPNG